MLCVRERERDRHPEQGVLYIQGWLGLSSLRIVLRNALPTTSTHTLTHSSAFLAPFALMEPQYITPQPMGEPAWEEVGPSAVDCKKAGHR